MIEIPGYKIIRLLGRGGMAEVYLAIQQSFEREVALKVMDRKYAEDEAYSERFLREAKIVSRLVHPNIVTVYDVGIADGHHFLSMEYVPGEDLKKARSRLTLWQRLGVVKDIAKALGFAGRKGYIHRDVKPENIMLHDEDGRAVLMDFGIARDAQLKSGMTQTGTAIGTPHYMSPEQARGRKVDPRSDIYSLGVLLFVMLTDYVPYDADSAIAVGLKHVSEPIPQLPEHVRAFQGVVNRAMAKEPDERYQSAEELLFDLEQFSRPLIDEIDVASGSSLPASAVSGYSDSGPTVVSHASADWRVTHPAHSGQQRVEPSWLHQHWAWLVGGILAASIVGLVIWQQQLPVEQRLGADTPLDSAVEPQFPSPVSKPAVSANQAAGVDVASIEEQVDEAEVQAKSREELLTRAQSLTAEMVSEPGNVVAIADLYRQLIADNPLDVEAGQGLQRLRAMMIDRIEAALSRGDLQSARLQLEWARSAFTAEAFVEKLSDLMASLETEERAALLIEQATQLFERDQLTQPEGDNAVALYRAVLALQPEHPGALSGLASVVRRYEAMAIQSLQERRLDQSMGFIENGLSVLPEHPGLQALRERISGIKQAEKLAARARSLSEAGQITQPAGDNSISVWRQVLKLDPANVEATRALSLIEADMVSQVEARIAAEEWQDARASIARTLAFFPNNLEVQELKSINEAARVEASSPRVNQLLVSDASLNGVSADQASELQVDQSLYVGFEYENFDAGAVIEARLIHLQTDQELQRFSVELPDTEGVKFLTFVAAGESYLPGLYLVNVLFEGRTLAARQFLVVPAQPGQSPAADSAF